MTCQSTAPPDVALSLTNDQQDEVDILPEHICNGEDAAMFPGTRELHETLCSRSGQAIAELAKIFEGRVDNTGEDISANVNACILDLIRFTRAVISGLYSDKNDELYINCLAQIYDPATLSSLFYIRHHFLGPSSDELASMDNEQYCDGVYTTIDILLSLLGDMILVVASGEAMVDPTSNSLPTILQTQKHEGNVRTASQLPTTFQDLPNLLRSQRSSPALKRLSLSLLFAAIVIRSDLVECDPWAETHLDPLNLSGCLESMIGEYSQIMTSGDISITYYASRAASSMLLVLYSTVDKAMKARSVTPYRPYTDAQLLGLARVAFAIVKADAQSVAPELDNCQIVLLRWGCFIPWAWSTWDDSRVLEFGVLKALTASWLCHIEDIFEFRPQSQPTDTTDDPCVLCPKTQHILKAAILINPAASFTAFFHQLNSTSSNTSRVSESDQTLEAHDRMDFEPMRLFRMMWCLAFLLSKHAPDIPSESLHLISEHVLILFSFLGSSVWENKVKAEIIRCLPFLKKATIVKVCAGDGPCGKDGTVSFSTGLANSIQSTLRLDRLLGQADDSILSLIVLLDLVAALCKCDTISCLPDSTATLLAKIMKELSSFSSLTHLDLRISLMNCLAAVKLSGSAGNKSSAQNNVDLTLPRSCTVESIFNLALDLQGSNLRLAAALASNATVSVRKTTDALLVAETWDYLCDALLSNAANQYATQGFVSDDSDEIEQICEGLAVLFSRTDTKISGFLLSSPLTLSLVDTLKRMLVADARHSCSYGRLFDKMQKACTLRTRSG